MPERTGMLRGVDWVSLVDAYGAAGDVPGLLHMLWSGDAAVRRGAYRALAGRLVHQGSRYEASAVAAGFLIDVVADCAAPDRFAACQVLRMIAIGDESYWLTELPDIAAVRREVARQATLTLAELEHEQRMWVAAAGDEDERRGRESAARYRDVVADRCAARWDLEAYDAVRSGVAVYVAALGSPDPAVRLHTAHLLAWFPEERDLVVPALTRVIDEDPDPVVAATACVSAGLCGATEADAGLVEALSRRLAGPNRAERWSAVLGLARLTGRPSRELIEELYVCLLDATEPVPDWPFLDGDMSGLAALTLARLDSDTAADGVEILAWRLAGTVSGADRFTLVGALLDAAFPDYDASGRGGDVGVTGSARIVEAQRAAVRALVDNAVWEDGPMVAMLLGRYGLPSAPELLRSWSAGDR
ncbi:hypothetical protein ACN27J_18980 [Solwaraspora sp. WMMB762]|uniref:hypothetical protein n=1 Tax=Solwaraspora sp. WMMB762 TaxID=3404120 RepID=UPI003B9408AF